MELGNLLFGHSFGEFEIKNRDIVNSKEWRELLKLCHCDSYGFTKNKKHETKQGGFVNALFVINPYYWGDDDEIANLPNFIYKPTGLEIRWYKYPFRDSYMSQNLTDEELKSIWQKCIDYVKENKT